MKYFFILLLTLILISGCSQKGIYSQPVLNDTVQNGTSLLSATTELFTVKYYASHSSGGGTRTLNITYTVKNGEIVSCDGTYIADMTDGKNSSVCEVEKMKTKQYNVPLELITTLSQDTKSGEVRDGSSWYTWEIIE